jgi:hypothetical protein
VETIVREDASDLLVKQLEHSAGGSADSTQSCLGLLTMINDYRANLGWRFEAHDTYAKTMTVTTSAILSLSNLVGASS